MGLLAAFGINVEAKDTVLFQIHIHGKHDPDRSSQVLTLLKELSFVRVVRSKLKNGHSAFQDYADGFEIGVKLAADLSHNTWRKAFRTAQMASLETRVAACSPTGTEYSLLYRLVSIDIDSEKIPPSYRQALGSLKERVRVFLDNTSTSFNHRGTFRTLLDEGIDPQRLQPVADDVLYWMRQAAVACDEAMKSVGEIETVIVDELTRVFPESVVIIKDL